MARLALLIAWALLVGCLPAVGPGDSVGVTLAAAATACDWAGTRSAAMAGWAEGRSEVGPVAPLLIGSTPSPAAVDAYFAGTLAALVVAERLLPRRWRPTLHWTVAVAGAAASYGNAGSIGPCGAGVRS